MCRNERPPNGPDELVSDGGRRLESEIWKEMSRTIIEAKIEDATYTIFLLRYGDVYLCQLMLFYFSI